VRQCLSHSRMFLQKAVLAQNTRWPGASQGFPTDWDLTGQILELSRLCPRGVTDAFSVARTARRGGDCPHWSSSWRCVPPALAACSSAVRWSTRVSLAHSFERNVAKFAPHLALKLIACGKLTFDKGSYSTVWLE